MLNQTQTATNPPAQVQVHYNIKAKIPKTIYYCPIKEYSYHVLKNQRGLTSRLATPRYFDLPQTIAAEDFRDLITQTDASLVSLVLNKANNPSYTPLVNKAFKGVKLVGVSKGDLPGYDFQVLTPFGFVVFIQSDVFMEALLRDGFNSETKELNSEFIFATIGRTTKLIRTNSALHKACIEKEQLMSRPELNIKTMSVGEVFQKKGGNCSIFLGFVSSTYPTGTFKTDLAKKFPIKYRNSKLMTLWWTCEYWNNLKDMKDNKNYFIEKCLPSNRQNSSVPSQISLKPCSQHQFVNRVEGIKLFVPEDVIFQVKRIAINSVGPFLSRRKSDFWELQKMRRLEKLINMTVFGMKPQVHEVCGKILERNKEYFEEYGKSVH